MSDRKEGWYHIKTGIGWECAKWEAGRWYIACTGFAYDDHDFKGIGHRIPSPDEPWQTVPVEAIKYAAEVLRSNAGPLTCEAAADGLESLLAAAPNPEDS